VWRQRDFGLFWTGESISEVGNSVTVVVVPLIAIDTLHASTFVVTVLTAMVWLPRLLVGVPAGAWIDRLPPRPVMLARDVISLTAYGSVPVAAWSGVLTVAQLITVTLLAGTATVFFSCAYQVLLPGIVGEADLTEGNAKLMGSREVAQIGGPGLGGFLANLALTGVDALIVVFLVRTVGLSSASAGVVVASFGVGGILGALVARPMGRRFGTARAILAADAGGLSCAAAARPAAATSADAVTVRAQFQLSPPE
jgi:hypothetical protein